MVPTPVPTPAHVSPVPTPQQSDAESAGNEEGAIAPPNPSDIEWVVNGGNYELDDLRKLRDLVDEKMKAQASSSQLTPVSG